MTKPKLISTCKYCKKEYGTKHADVFCTDRCRFDAKFKKTEKCWLWTGKPGSHGYGQFRHNGIPRTASSMAFLLYKGEIPEGMIVCHKCDNRLCVNPSHLFLGNHTDNMRDMVIKNRDKRRKLSDPQVREIRRKLAAGRSLRSLAKEYAITNQNVVHIKKGRTFVHL